MVELTLDLLGRERQTVSIHMSPYDTGKEKGIQLEGYCGSSLDLYGNIPLETAKLLRDALNKSIKVLEPEKKYERPGETTA